MSSLKLGSRLRYRSSTIMAFCCLKSSHCSSACGNTVVTAATNASRNCSYCSPRTRGPRPPTPPRPAKEITFRGRGMIDDSFYARGQSALDNRQWDQALDYFGQVISRNGSRVDGALY